MGSRTRAALIFSAGATALAALGAALVYAGQIDVGLYYDDYHMVRPWSDQDLHRVWYGSWDPTGIESVFFRPLSAYLFAGRFWLFGLNATAMHWVSIVGHVTCAVMVGWFVRNERGRTPIAYTAVWLYAVHPSLPHAQVSWLTNQMHLAESLVVLLALLAWQWTRKYPRGSLVAVVTLAVMAFLIKEDGVMLLPAIAALSLARSWLLNVQMPGREMAILIGFIFIDIVLVFFRQQRLGGLGGYALPDLDAALTNFTRGLTASLFLWPTRTPWRALASALGMVTIVTALLFARWRRDRVVVLALGLGLLVVLGLNLPGLTLPRPYPLWTWQAIASGSVVSVLIAGSGVALWRLDRPALFLIAAGALILLCFNTPFVLVSKREQYHLLALGSVILLAGSVQALSQVARGRIRLACVGALIVSACVASPLLARRQAASFLPCATNVLALDKEARGWWILPSELRSWIDAKERACVSSGTVGSPTDLPQVAWGVYDEGPAGAHAGSRWTSDRAVLLLGQATTAVSIGVRRADATPGHPVRVLLETTDGSVTVILDSAEKRYATVRFRKPGPIDLRRQHRLDVAVDGWFVPAVLDPSSGDLRRFGVEFEIVTHQ